MDPSFQNVAEYLLDGKVANREALATLEETYTYGDLRLAATDVAKYLVREGGVKGDRALLVSENGFFWVAAYLGILRAGLVCVPLPPSISPQDLDQILGTTESRFAFLQSSVAHKYKDRFGQIDVVTDKASTSPNGIYPPVSLKQLRESVRSVQCSFPSVEAVD